VNSCIDRIAPRRSLYTEALNPYFGYFYTIKKSLRKAKTGFQDIELIETDEFGKVLLLDHITQVAEKHDYQYHEPMVHPALCSHPSPDSVCIIGGGDGGVLRELVKYKSIKEIHLAEIDAGVIDFSRKYLGVINGDCFEDPRLQIHIGDGRQFISQQKQKYDIIIMDMTDPFGPSKYLYTREFYRMIKKALKSETGMFVMHSESPVSRPKAFSCIKKTLGTTFNNVNSMYLYIQMYAVLWSITICSDKTDISKVKPAKIDKTLSGLNIENLKVYNGATHVSMQVEFPYIHQILQTPARIITDAKPDFPDDFIST
jgi:spermidine synthase